jgi:flagellar basal-body rod modification protein FlgD
MDKQPGQGSELSEKISLLQEGVKAMAAAAIFAHRMMPGQAVTGNAVSPNAVSPMDTSSTGSTSSSSSSDNGSTISANDFLSLLVTEMQNQDPTADTDPNEYVDQLVQVNSLEQLISINQTLTASLDPSSSTSNTSGDTASGKVSAVPMQQSAAAPAPATANHKPSAMASQLHAPGNLSVPAANRAAQRVGHALDGHKPNKPTPILGRFPTAI